MKSEADDVDGARDEAGSSDMSARYCAERGRVTEELGCPGMSREEAA
jgi:hypothetical protein